MTWGWVNYKEIFILEWTNPLQQIRDLGRISIFQGTNKQAKSPYLKSVKSDNIPHSEDDWVILQFFREYVAAHFNIRLISDL